MTGKIMSILIILAVLSTAAWADNNNTCETSTAVPSSQAALPSPAETTGNVDLSGVLSSFGVNLSKEGIVNILQAKGNLGGMLDSLKNNTNLATILNSLPGGAGILNSARGSVDSQALVNGIITSIINQGGINIPPEVQNLMNNEQGTGVQNVLKGGAQPGTGK